MRDDGEKGQLVARCIVCRGNIHHTDRFEIWEGGYYCERHSLLRLRERALEYAELLAREVTPEPTG
jgi:hypothetical protein